jgi:L-threonylcarbamoyladenylate synthase
VSDPQTVETVVMPSHHGDTLSTALQVLARGGIVAFPTDTVYGLGADVFSNQAVVRLYRAKGRSRKKAIPVLIASPEDLGRVASGPSPMAERLGVKYWPGPLTLVVPCHPHLPLQVSPYPTVAVRVPDHPFARALLAASGPLAVTSANPSGKPSARTAETVLTALRGKVDLVVDGGETPGDRPSTIVDCTGQAPRLLREGPISMEAIRQALA